MSDKPWTDDEFPWVNEYMNANTKLGMAARIISRWERDWHKERFDSPTYRHAHNDIADLADTITEQQAELTRLRAQLDEAQQWETVTEGYVHDSSLLHVAPVDDGWLLEFQEGGACVWFHGSVRLQRRKEANDG